MNINFNTRLKSHARRAQGRQQFGQAMIEFSAITTVMTLLIVLLAALLVNTYFFSNLSYRVQDVACEGARLVGANKWWLGIQRREYNELSAREQAMSAVNAELEKMGLPRASNVHFDKQTILLQRKDTTITRLDFDVTGVKTIAGIFPAPVTIHASGIYSDAEHALTKHGQVLLHFVDPSDPSKTCGVRVPVYNATVGKDTAAHPTWMVAGNEAVGQYPMAYLRMECKQEAVLLKKNDDGDNIDRADWGPPMPTSPPPQD